MIINKNVLKRFLKKITMEGEQQITEGILDFSERGIVFNANSESQHARVMARLDSAAFTDYSAIGKVGINEMNKVIQVLSRFGDEVSLAKKGNLLTIKSDNKKVDIELVAEDYVKDSGSPTLEYETTLNLTAAELKGVFEDVKTNKDAVMIFSTRDNILVVTNTGKYKFHNSFDIEGLKGEVVVRMGAPLIAAVSNLDGNLEISLKTDYPMRIVEETENCQVVLIVAPRVNETDEE